MSRTAPAGTTAQHLIDLSAGTLAYEDTGGDGPVLVLLHGLLMDASLWAAPIAELSADHRCVAPTLPLGAHRHPMRADADLSLPGVARLVAEFLDRLDLRDVTLVGNDTGGALVQLLMADGIPRVERVVLVSCEAFDNFPPGLTGRTLVLAGRLSPWMFGLFMRQMRVRALRRLPSAFGWLTKRGTRSPRGGRSRCGGSRRSAVTPYGYSATRRGTRAVCWSRPRTGCGTSTGPPSWSGRARTG